MDEPTLYILMRTDMKSLNAGKAMAQAAHAGNQVIQNMRFWPEFEDSIHQWARDHGFGRTLVLGAKIDQIKNVMTELSYLGIDGLSYPMGWIIDPSYPIRDGEVTHHIEVETCFWIFYDGKDPKVKETLSFLPLHK